MGKKTAPRYPNRDRVILRRFVSQILFLLFGLALVVFYLLFNNAGENEDTAGTLDDPAASLSERTERQQLPAPPGTVPARTGPGQADSVPAEVPHAPSPARPDSAATPQTSQAPLQRGQPSTAVPAAPFSGQGIDEVAAALTQRYGGKAPTAWGERLDGVTTRLAVPTVISDSPDRAGNGIQPVLALTLDACGGKKGASYDAELIAFLRERRIPATLFVTSLWMRTNPGILSDLAADPLFEIAAHGSRHRPCSVSGRSVYGIKGTANFTELAEEVEGNLRDLERATGKRPRWFRSGTAYYDDVAVAAVHGLGCRIAGYSVAGDEGATLPAGKVAAKTLAARHGDILLYHMNKPASGTRDGLMKALPQLLERGFRFVRLSDPL